jgi:demethylmenaquinone methyltransferase/2-methoxy-6-polyprenyl-1,4-benzoquinol methylase
MIDTETYIRKLVESVPLREPVLRSAVRAQHLPPGSQGLDVGCGVGFQTRLLAEALGPSGHVTGVDLSPALLEYAEESLYTTDMADRISFREGNMHALPFPAATFDWVWSTDCAGYPVGDLLPILREFVRVVRPGGDVILMAWSGQTLLPGYPLLEARLNATCSAYAPYLKGQRAEAHFLRALSSYREAGLVETTAQTFVGDVQAPLSEGVRTAIISLFEMLWGERQPEVSPEDWAAYQRLCDLASPEFILDLPDYYGFFTYTLFRGKVPAMT